MITGRTPFGQTDLQVSRLCQGTAFRHLRRANSTEGLAVLHHCLISDNSSRTATIKM